MKNARRGGRAQAGFRSSKDETIPAAAGPQRKSTRRREDLALVRAFGRTVYRERERAGTIHKGDKGWIAEAGGRLLGSFHRELGAVHAVLDADARGRR
jgi:hypothetical protein